MEPPLALAVIIAGVSAGLLVSGAVGRRSTQRALVRWARRLRLPRSVVVAMMVSSLWASSRPLATAATPPAPVRLADFASSAGVVPAVASGTYEVETGDCLWRIARRLLIDRGRPATGTDVGRAWRTIYDLNRSVIGDNPDLIHPGQVFEIPEEL